ncbi:uncharacterized protein LOC129794734 [Lutzomyia longipalpis]|uniref:uncharacterized protein LOC129794734 n=1 Tax=Lutzomyia longipalpis TaxID=7200 RepID=UPI002483A2A9|nr:uncharacterized protein LOC129794734 [Lutzomyia longipalpis]XP_055691564.1 uncharacterized protein LOC129794734 [Lutzomyia longipalpis]
MNSNNMPSEGIEIIFRKGKTILVLDGYQYRIHRKTEEIIRWTCIRDKKYNCRGNIKTDYNYVIRSKIDHSCVPDHLEILVKKAMIQCKNRIITELSTPVPKIYKAELEKFDLINSSLGVTLPPYNSVSTNLYRLRRMADKKYKKGEDMTDMLSRIVRLSGPDSLQYLSSMKDIIFGRKKMLPIKPVEEAKRSWAFQCEHCGKILKSKNDLVHHMRTVHLLEVEGSVKTHQKSPRRKVAVPVIKDSSSSKLSSGSELPSGPEPSSESEDSSTSDVAPTSARASAPEVVLVPGIPSTTCPNCKAPSISSRTISTQTDLSFHKLTKLTHIFSIDEMDAESDPLASCPSVNIKQEEAVRRSKRKKSRKYSRRTRRRKTRSYS